MKSDWMTASSYGRTRELITAINTISIHAKLILADMVDPHNGISLKKGRETLSSFLVSFENILDDATRAKMG